MRTKKSGKRRKPTAEMTTARPLATSNAATVASTQNGMSLIR